MKIAVATAKDIPTIRCLAKETWPGTFCDILSPQQMEYMLDMMYSDHSLAEQMSQGHCYILVNKDDAYLGYLSYQLNINRSTTTKIHKIYVHPSAQGKGVGRFLIQAVENIALKSKNTLLSLNVNRYNKAIDFYLNMGFDIAGNEDIDIGNNFLMEDYIMTKELRKLL